MLKTLPIILYLLFPQNEPIMLLNVLVIPVSCPCNTSPVDCSFTVHCRYNCKVIGMLHHTDYIDDPQALHKQLSISRHIVTDYHGCHIILYIALQIACILYSSSSPQAALCTLFDKPALLMHTYKYTCYASIILTKLMYYSLHNYASIIYQGNIMYM